jgi:hypothetical protein
MQDKVLKSKIEQVKERVPPDVYEFLMEDEGNLALQDLTDTVHLMFCDCKNCSYDEESHYEDSWTLPCHLKWLGRALVFYSYVMNTVGGNTTATRAHVNSIQELLIKGAASIKNMDITRRRIMLLLATALEGAPDEQVLEIVKGTRDAINLQSDSEGDVTKD